jgi:hypothetical protein
MTVLRKESSVARYKNNPSGGPMNDKFGAGKGSKKPAPAAPAPAATPAPAAPAYTPPAKPAFMATRPPAAPVKPPFTVTATPTPQPVKRTVTKEQIAKRAYEIWVAKGRRAGQDALNWQQAERELLGNK